MVLNLVFYVFSPPSPGTFGKVWRHFWLSRLGGTWCYWRIPQSPGVPLYILQCTRQSSTTNNYRTHCQWCRGWETLGETYLGHGYFQACEWCWRVSFAIQGFCFFFLHGMLVSTQTSSFWFYYVAIWKAERLWSSTSKPWLMFIISALLYFWVFMNWAFTQ